MYILSTVGVVFVGRLVCPVNILYMELSYMELSYTGSLNRSTRASEHVTVQISYACKTTAGFINCFPRINFVFDVYLTKLHRNVPISFVFDVYLLTKLHRNVYILSTVGVIFMVDWFVL